MAAKVGNTAISAAYVGGTTISAMYVGSTQVDPLQNRTHVYNLFLPYVPTDSR